MASWLGLRCPNAVLYFLACRTIKTRTKASSQLWEAQAAASNISLEQGVYWRLQVVRSWYDMALVVLIGVELVCRSTPPLRHDAMAYESPPK